MRPAELQGRLQRRYGSPEGCVLQCGFAYLQHLQHKAFPSMHVNGLLPCTWLHAALVAVYLLCAVTLSEHVLEVLQQMSSASPKQ